MRRPRPVNYKRSFWNLIVSLTFVGLPCAAYALELSVVGEYGDYVTVDTKDVGKIVGRGNIWKTRAADETHEELLTELSRYRIHDITIDGENDRLFVWVAPGRADHYWGFAIFRLSDLTLLDTLEKEMPLTGQRLMIAPRNKAIYLHYTKSSDEKVLYVIDKYDGRTYAELSENVSPLDRDGPNSACFLDDGEKMYANRRIFDLRTDKVIKTRPIEIAERIGFYAPHVNCEDNPVAICDDRARQDAELLLYDFLRDSLARMDSGLTGTILSSWRLFPGGNLVVFAELSSSPLGQSRILVGTGRVELFDMASNKKVASIDIPIEKPESARLFGFIADGEQLLLYRSATESANDVSVVNLDAKKVLGKISTPFWPVGFWYR